MSEYGLWCYVVSLPSCSPGSIKPICSRLTSLLPLMVSVRASRCLVPTLRRRESPTCLVFPLPFSLHFNSAHLAYLTVLRFHDSPLNWMDIKRTQSGAPAWTIHYAGLTTNPTILTSTCAAYTGGVSSKARSPASKPISDHASEGRDNEEGRGKGTGKGKGKGTDGEVLNSKEERGLWPTGYQKLVCATMKCVPNFPTPLPSTPISNCIESG